MDELAGELPFVQEDIDRFRQYCLQNAYRRERLKKGDVLQMPEGNNCCFLHKGRLKVFIGTDSGSERLMWFLENGNIIPEGSGETFSKRLVADCDTEVLYITEKAVYTFALTGEEEVAVLLRHYKKRYILLLQSILQEHRRKQPQSGLPFSLPDRHQLWQRRLRRPFGGKTAQPQRHRRPPRHPPQQRHPLPQRPRKTRHRDQTEKIPDHPRYPSAQGTAHSGK